MAINTDAPHSRRALLAGSLGALAAFVANAIGRPMAASAADGDAVLLGRTATAIGTTRINITGNANNVIWGASTSGVGVRGSSSSSFGGSFTSASSAAVRGGSTNSTGMLGLSGSTGLPSPVSRTGVYGFANQDATSVGVRGESVNGIGMFAYRGPSPAPTPAPGSGVFGYASGTSTVGVAGRSDLGSGMVGLAEQSGPGVYGQSVQGVGVVGRVQALSSIEHVVGPIGVYGEAATGMKGRGIDNGSNLPVGVHGESVAIGVFGRSGFGPPDASHPFGVYGISDQSSDGIGVAGHSTSGTGVEGRTATGTGVSGLTGSGIGVDGEAASDNSGGIGVKGRSQGATGIGVLGVTDDSDAQAIGVKGSGATGVLGTTSTGIAVHGVATANTAFAGVFDGKVSIGRFVDVSEIAAPAAPGADTARLFVRDNGSGKTQLCVRFNTGAVIVLATQA